MSKVEIQEVPIPNHSGVIGASDLDKDKENSGDEKKERR